MNALHKINHSLFIYLFYIVRGMILFIKQSIKNNFKVQLVFETLNQWLPISIYIFYTKYSIQVSYYTNITVTLRKTYDESVIYEYMILYVITFLITCIITSVFMYV